MLCVIVICFFKQKTAYEMRISDWSSDVCSSDLRSSPKMSDLYRDIKQLIIDALGLEDISTDDIGDHQTLFGEGLGLDSVDALELGLAIQKQYGIKIDADAKDTRNHFSNVASLAAFVTAKRVA